MINMQIVEVPIKKTSMIDIIFHDKTGVTPYNPRTNRRL